MPPSPYLYQASLLWKDINLIPKTAFSFIASCFWLLSSQDILTSASISQVLDSRSVSRALVLLLLPGVELSWSVAYETLTLCSLRTLS
jgi:hypothetical protein